MRQLSSLLLSALLVAVVPRASARRTVSFRDWRAFRKQDLRAGEKTLLEVLNESSYLDGLDDPDAYRSRVQRVMCVALSELALAKPVAPPIAEEEGVRNERAPWRGSPAWKRNAGARKKKAVVEQPDQQPETLPEPEEGCENITKETLAEEEQTVAARLAKVGLVVKTAKGYPPRSNQLLMVLLLTDGALAPAATEPSEEVAEAGAKHKHIAFGQLHTGQGKTLIAAMVALYMKDAAQSSTVRLAIGILTTNEVLTRQNYAETAEIFAVAEHVMQLKLKVATFNTDTTDGAAEADIVYLSPFALARDYADLYARRSNQRPPLLPWHLDENFADADFRSMVIVDEVDAILYDGVGETFLSTKPLPYADVLIEIATRIAQVCSEQKRFREVGDDGDLRLDPNGRFVTSACEDPTTLNQLKTTILREVSKDPTGPSDKLEKQKMGPVSADQLYRAKEQAIASLGNSRMYSIASLNGKHTLSSVYRWLVETFDMRFPNKGREHVHELIRDGHLSELRRLQQHEVIAEPLSCVEKPGDFGICAQFRAFVTLQLPRWLAEARNLLGSQPALRKDHNYIVMGRGLCAYWLGDTTIHPELAPPDMNSTCHNLDRVLMCKPEDADGHRDFTREQEIKALTCATLWLAKVEKLSKSKSFKSKREADPLLRVEHEDLLLRLTKLRHVFTKKGPSEMNADDDQRGKLVKIRSEMSFARVIYVDYVSGLIRDRMRFNGFKHLFLEYKHNGAIITRPNTQTLALSRIRALEGFDIVTGFTGTLPTPAAHLSSTMRMDVRSKLLEREHSLFTGILKHLYGGGSQSPKLVYVAPFMESQRIERGTLRVDSEIEKFKRLGHEVNALQERSEQCALVVVQDIGIAYATQKMLLDIVGRPAALFKGDGYDNSVTEQRYVGGDIVVTTAVGSRGVDWHCEAADGFEVVSTYMSESLRVQRQIMGRSARSGEKGSYLEIVTDEEMENSLRKQGTLQNHIVKQVISSLRNDLQTDIVNHMTTWIIATAEKSGSNAVKTEMKDRTGKFRLWLTDTKYNELDRCLKGLISNRDDVEGVAEARASLRAVLVSFRDDMGLEEVENDGNESEKQPGIAIPQVISSVAGIEAEVVREIRRRSATLSYLEEEVGKQELYARMFEKKACSVIDESCSGLPPFDSSRGRRD